MGYPGVRTFTTWFYLGVRTFTTWFYVSSYVWLVEGFDLESSPLVSGRGPWRNGAIGGEERRGEGNEGEKGREGRGGRKGV
jgi:hypothetical protein